MRLSKSTIVYQRRIQAQASAQQAPGANPPASRLARLRPFDQGGVYHGRPPGALTRSICRPADRFFALCSTKSC